MKDVKEIVQDIAIKLRGHNALIQIQIDGQYFVKRIGNINQLIDNPKIIIYKEERSFLDWMEGEIDKETYTAGTIANHKAALAVLRRFKEGMTFTQIDYKCICDFENFLKGAGYAINTIAKFMKIFRRFVNLAIDEEVMTVYPFRKYHIKTENVQKQSLTERELRRIEDKEEKAELTEEERKVVKGFLFSVYSGLRFSDIVQVTKQHIKNIYRNKWVVLRMQKTDHEVRIPISKMFGGKAATMIQENKTTTGKLFQLPCNARCNLILKRVLKRFNIHRHITFHCARHTCATVLLSKGVSLPIIQHILGHQSIKTTQVYSAVKDTTINKEIRRAFR